MGGGPVQGSGPSPEQPWGTVVPLNLNIQAVKWGHPNAISWGSLYSSACGQQDEVGWGGGLSQDRDTVELPSHSQCWPSLCRS